jgi:hypothetical protein
MQTLYQYRTYSVDSSEESGAEEEETHQVRAIVCITVRVVAKFPTSDETRHPAGNYRYISGRYRYGVLESPVVYLSLNCYRYIPYCTNFHAFLHYPLLYETI